MKWGGNRNYQNCPCKDCKNRCVEKGKNCHDTCSDYKEYKGRTTAIKEKRHKEQDIKFALRSLGDHRVMTHKRKVG